MSSTFPHNKTDNMYIAMKTRIQAYPELIELLLSTQNENIEFPGSDYFWGTQGGRGGENWNGKLLERIRDEFVKK
jgi:predicted NAD-dependent protein-ADP-ribosyltransferase YbiA (DUF1768 family)